MRKRNSLTTNFVINRDAVAELRHTGFDTSSTGSDSDLDHNEEVVSNGSGDTEGPEEDGPSSLSGDDFSSSKAETNWPYTFLEAPNPVRSDVDFDRHHAREFAKLLASELVPKLVRLRSSIEVKRTNLTRKCILLNLERSIRWTKLYKSLHRRYAKRIV